MIQDFEQQLQTAIANGLSRYQVEALLGISFDKDQLQLYRKYKAIYDLNLRKKRKERKYEHLSNTELQHKHIDKLASIDKQMSAAFENVDRDRRDKAEKSLPDWVRTYCVGPLLEEAPPDLGNDVLLKMDKALRSHGNYMICMPRGHGKSSYAICAAIYALAAGIQDYVVIISNNAGAASQLMSDLWRIVSDEDSVFAVDYPEICLPFHLCNGSYRRKQTFNGHSTGIKKNSTEIVLPRIDGADGTPLKTSDAVITVRGVTSGLRGMKHGTKRPSLILLDDLQSSEMAASPEQVAKLMDTIRKDIMNLGGKERLSIIQTATPIQPDDLVDKIRHDPNWNTDVYKGIIRYPDNMNLWEKYLEIYDSESVNGEDHTRSLDFYRQRFTEMNAGSQVFNPKRFSKTDGHISAIQKMLEHRHVIGKSAFEAEYQMNPQRAAYQIDILPGTVVGKIDRSLPPLTVPDGFIYTAGAIDLNTSYGATVLVMSFKLDTSSVVVWHRVFPMNIDQKLTDIQYNQAVYDRLADILKTIQATGIKIDGVAIDCGGRQWDAVCDFCRQSQSITPIPCAAFAGRSSIQFNPLVKSRLRNAVGRTVLCGSPEEHVKSGSGQKYVFFDADFFKETAQRSFLGAVGSPGTCRLYCGEPDEHTDFAIQICNERLKFKLTKNGRDIYSWDSRDPHDYLDCAAMCHAVATSQGMSASGRPPGRRVRRPRVKVV